MRKFFLCLVAVAILASCHHSKGNKNRVSDNPPDTAFRHYGLRFIETLWKENPDWATSVGYHVYDTVLIIPDSTAKQAALTFVQQQLDSLQSFDLNSLNDANKIDYQLIKNYLQSTQWAILEQKNTEWDPAVYNVSNTFAFILNENYAPLESRLLSFATRLKYVPAYYDAAQKNIKNPVPELTALAIEQNTGGLSVFEKDFADSLEKTTMPVSEKTILVTRAQSAAKAIREYIGWLRSIKPAHPRSFRLGKALYEQKFKYDIQSAYTAAQIYEAAIARKHFVHGEMASICRQLWPRYFGNTPFPADSLDMIGRIIDTLSVQHVEPAAFQSAIEKQLPALIAFIKKKNLLYIDPTKPLIVRKEPAYMAGVAGASISAPGPYDKNGNTYYNVGSLEGWPAEKATNYLREYNQYILQILNIHEAIPGHYTQLVYANQSPSLIKSLLANGAMVEGWAVYTEQMMLENGYGNNSPEMWLMWYKWNLRTVCNTILDYSVHVKDMRKEDAIRMLTKEAFQQQAEAAGKWKRVSVSSVQLTSYYTGYKEIMELRKAYQQRLGKDFDLKTFHEKFLRYGSAPVKYIRQLMLP